MPKYKGKLMQGRILKSLTITAFVCSAKLLVTLREKICKYVHLKI